MDLILPLAFQKMCYVLLVGFKGISFTTGSKLPFLFPRTLLQMDREPPQECFVDTNPHLHDV